LARAVEANLRDTIEAGAGLVDEAVARIADLVRFDAEGGAVALGREAAHSASRIPARGRRPPPLVFRADASSVGPPVDAAPDARGLR